MTMDIDRRDLLRKSALGALAFSVGGAELMLTPRQAKARDVPLSVLSEGEARALEAFGEVLAPGAGAGGIVHYIDSQLAKPPAESLLMIRYLGVAAPHDGFYKAGLAALDGLARARFDEDFAALGKDRATALVKEISGAVPDGWRGPPAPFVYFVVRADAIDVVYGTMEGFKKMGVPYMAHIEPPKGW